jgi:hypothetical protein
MYIANIDRSTTPAIEAKLPRDVPILREPFTAEQLRALVGELLARTPSLLDVASTGTWGLPHPPTPKGGA